MIFITLMTYLQAVLVQYDLDNIGHGTGVVTVVWSSLALMTLAVAMVSEFACTCVHVHVCSDNGWGKQIVCGVCSCGESRGEPIMNLFPAS